MADAGDLKSGEIRSSMEWVNPLHKVLCGSGGDGETNEFFCAILLSIAERFFSLITIENVPLWWNWQTPET